MVFLKSIYMITYSFRKAVPGLLMVTKFGHHMLELTSINSPFGLGILINSVSKFKKGLKSYLYNVTQ